MPEKPGCDAAGIRAVRRLIREGIIASSTRRHHVVITASPPHSDCFLAEFWMRNRLKTFINIKYLLTFINVIY
jgi:hypothetical protein